MELNQLVSSAALLLALSSLGCSKILGIEEKRLSTDAGSDSCGLIAGSEPAIRIMNAIPESPVFDLCHKRSNQSSYGRPWFAGSSTSCGPGVAYTQFTRNLAIAAGTYDFKLVPAGSKCDAAGIEAAGVTIAPDASITLMAYGSELATGRISILPNRTLPTDSQPVRFVHALNNSGVMLAGLRSKASPNTIGTMMFSDVEYGKTAKENGDAKSTFSTVDAMGYVTVGGPSFPVYDLEFSVQQAIDNQVMLTAPISVTHGHVYTIFALGTRGEVANRPKIWSCDETTYLGPLLTCGNPDRIAFEVFNPNITDAFSPFVEERTGPLIDAILAEDTDLLCITELYNPKVVEQLRSPDRGNFAYRLFSDDIAPTRVTSLTATADGQTPSYPEIACSEELAAGLQQWFDCSRAVPGCTAEDPNHPGEHVLAHAGDAALGCMIACGDPAATGMISEIQAGTNVNAGSCYWCAITHLAGYESLEHTMSQCTTKVPEAERRHLAFGGTTGIAVLSRKHVLGDSELVLLPSSGWQRAALRVAVTAENGAVFDYWCTSIRFPNTEEVLSYAGPYGTWGKTGSAEEQALEVANAVAVIDQRAKSTGIPAVVAIVANTGPEYVDPKTKQTLVYGFVPEIYDLMGSRWPVLMATDYTPACTFCGDAASNPLNSFDASYRFWTSHLFGVGVFPSAVESTSRTFMDPVVSIPTSDGSVIQAPVSQYYGLRSVVRMTQ